MIEFEEVGFDYGGPPVLAGITLTLAPSSMTVIVGGQGSGKSTLARLCTRDLRQTDGRIRYFGEAAPASRNAVATLRRRVGLVPGVPGFLDHLSVRDNVALPLRAGGGPAEARADDLRALLDWVGLTGCADSLPAGLSPGERQRAALARAVVLSPDVIVADEPGAGGDGSDAARLADLLAELHGMGKAVLILTREPDVGRLATDRAPAELAALVDGRLVVVEPAA